MDTTTWMMVRQKSLFFMILRIWCFFSNTDWKDFKVFFFNLFNPFNPCSKNSYYPSHPCHPCSKKINNWVGVKRMFSSKWPRNLTFFVGKDVAMALGYSNPSNALQVHVDNEDKTTYLIQVSGLKYKSKTTFINESGLYSLILSSQPLIARPHQ